MGYLIFHGVSTESLTGVYVGRMPDHKKAGKRFSEYYVKGRDGALHVNEGFSNFDLTTTLVLVNAGAGARYAVNAWADGTSKLVTSDDPTRAYMATVEEEVVWQRVKAQSAVSAFSTGKSYIVGDIVVYNGDVYEFTAAHSGAWSTGDVTLIPVPNGFFDTAEITFNCQPCMVERVDSIITLTQTSTIINPGSAVAFPKIQVNGSGNADFTFNGRHIQIPSMTANVPVFIDCDSGYVWTESGATSITGEIPDLSIGTNTITFGSNVTSLVVTPHWRWV